MTVFEPLDELKSATMSETEFYQLIKMGLYRLEEKNFGRDQWGCFRAENSILYSQLKSPFFDVIMQKRLKNGTSGDIRTPVWPSDRPFAVALSHDVDAIKNPGRTDTPDHFFWNFDAYLQLEEQLGFRSAFYVVAMAYEDSINPDYDIVEDPLRSTLRQLTAQGWDVGLHLSYGSHLNLQKIRQEKDRLEQILGAAVLGGRCHFLPFEVEVTPFLMKEVGFVYDTTLGYNEIIGFRSGTSFPHRFLDEESKTTGGVLELPLHIMDGALFWDMGLTDEEALEEMKNMAGQVENVGGCLNVLWHLRVLDNPDYPGWGDVYKSFLMWLKDKNAWVTTPGDVAQWWIEREQKCVA